MDFIFCSFIFEKKKACILYDKVLSHRALLVEKKREQSERKVKKKDFNPLLNYSTSNV